MPHITRVTILQERFPTDERYPFSLSLLQSTRTLDLGGSVTLFVGENGTGKTTLLRAIAQHCGIYIWEDEGLSRYEVNPYEKLLHRCIEVEWADEKVPGSYFSSQSFQHFAGVVDTFAVCDPDQLKHFGGKSLITQSHGQSLMSFFKSRYRLKGLYLLDEPETALSPKTQLELVAFLHEMAGQGHAQFIICTHSPILLACPGATIYSFDQIPVRTVRYEDTAHYRLYRDFMADTEKYFLPEDKQKGSLR